MALTTTSTRTRLTVERRDTCTNEPTLVTVHEHDVAVLVAVVYTM